ncbi:hypothetical protein QU487_06620 [Crenobacter sp. SG2305]|uniref:hypothetical protein n=1 Tax=Crenobacter oryzisoli TaxID=3056844 RepID=UPI0025AAB8FA|nr:hypothetical protein [Crenobacter sp. SG2305]MDN0082427.1 hypothetical protein [Crenobacter sp. SG2305]
MVTPPYFLDHPTPTSPTDLLTGEFLRIAERLSRCRGFVGWSVDTCADILAVGMGYPDAATLKDHAASGKSSDAPLPDLERCLMEGIAWRIYLAGLSSLGDAMDAIVGIWPASTLSVRTRYDRYGFLNEPGKHFFTMAAWSDHLVWSFNAMPPRPLQAVLDADGLLFLRGRFEYLQDLVAAFWTEAVDLSIAQLQEEIVSSSRLPLVEAIKQSPTYAAPPGLRLISYFDKQGDLVGHGFFFPETNAYLKHIYPPDGEALLTAAVALWHREVPPSGMVTVPPLVFCGEDFCSPWQLQPVEREPSRIDVMEQADIEIAGREPLPVVDGQVACGVDFLFGHEHYTRRPNAFAPDEFEGLLGLHLPQKEEFSSDFDWLLPVVPYALDEQTLWTLRQVNGGLTKLCEREGAWLAKRSNQAELSTLLSQTARFAHPVFAQASERQCQGTMGMVAAFDVPDGGERVATLYPELSGLSVNCLGDYALDYYGKNGIRHHGQPDQREPAFIAYACLRNLGLDPLWTFRSGQEWIAFFCLIRSTLGKEGCIDADRIDAIGELARTLMQKTGALFSLFENLDQGLSITRLRPYQKSNPDWIEVSATLQDHDAVVHE